KVTTKDLDGFTITVPPSSAGRMFEVTIDDATLRLKAAATVSFTKVPSGWRPGRLNPMGKRPGAEGPIAEAISSRHISVYGTSGARWAEELEARRKIAATAAAWSSARSHLALSLPVKADSAVTAADLDTSDLVLFGTAATNSVIARLAPNLPLAL